MIVMLLYVKKLNLLTTKLSFKTQPYYSDALACSISKVFEQTLFGPLFLDVCSFQFDGYLQPLMFCGW